MTWQVQNAGFNWIEDNGNDVFIIFGDFTFQEVFSLEVQLGSDPGVTDTNSGLIVDNGTVEINNFTVTLQNADVGFLTIKELTVAYALDASTGDYNLDLNGSAYFPETGTAVTTTFDFNTTTDSVDEFSMSVELGGDQQIALGTTGLFVVAASIQVDNPSSIDNMQITGSVRARVWISDRPCGRVGVHHGGQRYRHHHQGRVPAVRNGVPGSESDGRHRLKRSS